MQETLEKILAAEAEARRVVEDGRREAESLARDASARSEAIVASARERAGARLRERLSAARAEAAAKAAASLAERAAAAEAARTALEPRVEILAREAADFLFATRLEAD